MSNGPASYTIPTPGVCGHTTREDGSINFAMVMHNAHLLAKRERNSDIRYGYKPKAYSEYFAAELRDQMREAHSMSAWKRGNGVKVDAAFIASVSTDGPINFKIAAE